MRARSDAVGRLRVVTTLPDTTDASVITTILGEAGYDMPAELTLLMHSDEFDTWKVGDSMVVKFARTQRDRRQGRS